MAKQKDHPQHSFFKVFIGLGGPAHPFLVPPSYVKAVGGALPGEYTLEGPRGERKVVEVKKNGCQWSFRGGWGPFMEEYSVRYGDILVFTLHGKAELHFQVYDRNGYLKKSSSFEDGKQVTVEKRSTVGKGHSGKGAKNMQFDPKHGRLLDLYVGYEAYEDDGMEESSMIEISSSSDDTQNGLCNENNDEDLVVCCKRAKKTDVLDVERKSVVQAGSSLRAEDPNEASVRFHRKRVRFMHKRRKIQDNLCRDSVSPVEKLHYSRQSPHRKSSKKPNLCPKNEVRMRKEMNNRPIKREECVDIKVVAAKRQPSSTIYTTVHCSDEQKDKLIRTAQRLKFGRPLAAVILSPSYTKKGIMHFPKPFFQTFFHDELIMIGANVVKKKGRLITFSDGKIWHVDFLFSKSSVRAVAGWHAFVCQNGLREGDFCFFEFIKTRPVIELRVSTSRPHKSHAAQAYSMYEGEKIEEPSAIEISSSSSDSQDDTCNESSDGEVVVCCKRAKKTNELDVECKPVVRGGSSFKTEDLNVSSRIPGKRVRFLQKRRKMLNNSARSQGNFRRDSVSPDRKLHSSRLSYRKNSAKRNLYLKNAVLLDEEMKDRSIKREDTVNIRVVANRQPSSSIYTMTGYSRELRDKLVRAAQKFKLGRPLAVVSLTPSSIKYGYLYFPKPFFQTFFNDLLKISASSVKKRGRLITYANGDIWPVEFHFYGGQVRMVGGWCPFVQHNGLREGDICVFEFIKTWPLIELRVSTSRPRNKNTEDDSS